MGLVGATAGSGVWACGIAAVGAAAAGDWNILVNSPGSVAGGCGGTADGSIEFWKRRVNGPGSVLGAGLGVGWAPVTAGYIRVMSHFPTREPTSSILCSSRMGGGAASHSSNFLPAAIPV